MISFSRSLRVFTIQRALMKYGFDEIVFSIAYLRPVKFLFYLFPWNWFPRNYGPKSTRIRRLLEDLGPIFVKFGQILSTRHDLLPEDIIKELSLLQDRVPPFDSAKVKVIVEEAFGVVLDDIFARFDMNPIASASIAQVHEATLCDGTEVVVKVVRPDILATIKQDVSLMKLMASLIERYWEPGAKLKPSLIVSEVEKTISGELDMLREASNASQLSRNFIESDIVKIPKVYWEYTRTNVLVMEKMIGLNVSDIEGLKRAGVDLKKLASNGLDILFTQIFRDHFFHADLHPGNIFIIPGKDGAPDRYGVVDFGIMGSLSEFDQRYLAENCAAFLKKDYRRVAQLHVESGWVPADTRVDEFETAIRTVSEPIFDRPVKDISLGDLLLRLFQTARSFNMEIQPQLLLLQKTLLGVEGITRNLDPEIDMWESARPAVQTFMAERLKLKNIIHELREEMPGWMARLPEMPKSIFDVVDKVRSGKLNVQTHDASINLLKEEMGFMLSRLVYVLAGIALLVFALLLSVWSDFGKEIALTYYSVISLLVGLAGGMILGSFLIRKK